MPISTDANPSGAGFAIRELIEGARHTISMMGELDLVGVPDVQRAVRRACQAKPAEVVLDLGELTFLDSSGLKSILWAEQLCAGGGCRFALRPGPANVQDLFAITGLLEHLPFAPGDEAADER